METRPKSDPVWNVLIATCLSRTSLARIADKWTAMIVMRGRRVLTSAHSVHGSSMLEAAVGSPVDRPRPWFARMYARVSQGMEAEGMAQLRRDLLAGISGDIIEVGAGNGMNFSHYPVGVASILAVEPEPYLRRQAARAAGCVDVAVAVVPGRAERLPADDASKDAGVVSLMLCALRDQDVALRELHRVIRPGGQLRFLEHVAANGTALRMLQRIADATVWPILTGGCRTARDPLTSMVHAGFELQQVRYVRFPETILPVPSSPHALGVAIRR